jgi:hypothetical protein
MKQTRLAAIVAAAALAVGAAVATASVVSASPAPAAHHPHPHGHSHQMPREATKLTISNKVIAHARHRVDVITGVLTADRKGLAGQIVVLEVRMGSMPRWHVLAARVTGTGGTVTFGLASKVKTQVKLAFAGTATLRPSHSNAVTILV